MASSIKFLFFLTNILIFSRAQGVNTRSLDLRDVIPAGMEAYHDYELVHLEEREEEDTVYITKRAPVSPTPDDEDCNDCNWFSPWDYSTEDGVVAEKRQAWESTSLGMNGTWHRLKVGSPVYDFSPYDNPDSNTYYEIKEIGKFQYRNKPTEARNRGTSVEHILEWQALVDFLRIDKDRCKHIAKFFQKVVEIDTTLKVKTNDGKGVEIDEAVRGKERALDYVAHQFPGNGAGGFVNKFKYEFVSLHDGVNTRKERLWSMGQANKAKPKMIADNDIKKNIQNGYKKPYKKPDGTTGYKWTHSDKNQGLCTAVVALREIIAVWGYHATPSVQAIMTTQVNRIGDALKYLEDGPLKNIDFSDPKDSTKTIKYQPMASPLKTQWDDYMKTRYASVKQDLEKTMSDWVPKLQAATAKRSLMTVEKRGTKNNLGPRCAEEPDRAKMKFRINSIDRVYKTKGAWNP
ncbi:hypothetical protein P280DRAFT_523023 [Massarina eburnea CBS 473.64]|uniref:Uncharacterized protein n=1 Tax=Massarina eburnea CBS 473.64 TaxID=1395130 RepID=A0A6A6RMV1_9PLEO|nr:hypothetical protein P280DRAFT_523023 [Massarina eburnea CBS 473.64]